MRPRLVSRLPYAARVTPPAAVPAPAIPLDSAGRPRNVVAVIGFVVWLVVVAVMTGSVVAGFLVLDDTADNAMAPLVFPLAASLVMAPVAALGLIVSVIAVARRGRQKVLAVVDVVLLGLTVLALAPVFFAGISAGGI